MREKFKRVFLIIVLALFGTLMLTGNAAAQVEPFLGSLVACIVIIIILPIILAIVIGIWIYRDANSRGMSGALWLLLMFVMAFLFNFIGIAIIAIIYFIVRSDKPTYPPPGYYPPQQPMYQPPGYGAPPPPPPGYGYPPPPPPQTQPPQQQGYQRPPPPPPGY